MSFPVIEYAQLDAWRRMLIAHRVTATSCVVFLVMVWRENKKRVRGERDYRLTESDADNLGDDHPHFRFTY